MRFTHLLVPIALFAVGLIAPHADADPITFTFSGNVTGSLAGTDFTGAPFLMTLVTDTNGVFQPAPRFPNILTTQNAALDFTVNGVSGTFSDPFHVFRGGGGPRASIGLSPQSGDDILDITSSTLATYDLKTAFGPLTQAPPDFLNVGEAYATSAGDLIFTDDRDAIITFQATLVPAAVPEPGLIPLLTGSACTGCGFLLRRRQQRLRR